MSDIDRLKQRVSKCQTLPTLPTVAIQLLEHCRAGEVNLRETARILASDPALSARVLQFVNSPLYGMNREVTTLSHAVALLGFNSVRTLALSFSLVRNLQQQSEPGFDYSYYWKRSIICAASARALGDLKGSASREELFLVSLLQDIGMLALQQVLGDDYGQLVARAQSSHQDLIDLERAVLGCDHSIVSGWMAYTWGLPELFQSALKYSHTGPPEGMQPALAETVEWVELSGLLAEIWMVEDTIDAYEKAIDKAEAHFGLNEQELRQLLEKISVALPDLTALFETDDIDSDKINHLLDDARLQLVHLSLQNVQQASDLATENDTLREKSERDGLTGLYNRSQLDASLETAFDNALTQEKPLSIIFCDIDNFKTINDTQGHQAGDAVLKHIGKLLSSKVRGRDIVGRYGGDEFVLILPATDAPGAARVADRVHRAVANKSVSIAQGEVLQLTTSVGHATSMPGSHFSDVAALCDAADKALYASKRAGRNQVTAFSVHLEKDQSKVSRAS